MASTNTLTDLAIRKAAPGDKPRKLADGGGMYLEIRPSGARYWRLKYRVNGTEKRLSLGVYPEVTLAQARVKRDAARALVAQGIDPSETRKAEKVRHQRQQIAQALAAAGEPVPDTFEYVAREWYETRRDDWSTSYGEKVLSRLVKDVFPFIGNRPVSEVTPPELLALLRRIEGRGVVETAHRARENCSQVFRFAVATGRATSDPARDLVDALKRPRVKHFAAITDPMRFGELLRAIDRYQGTPVVRAALKLASLVFLRPGEELRSACWDEFDLDAGVWSVPAARMKRRKDGKEYGPVHLVPLSRQAVEVLRDLYPLTGGGPVVFRGYKGKNRPISENTLNAALDAMGFDSDQHRAHGFRASARTMLAERLNVDEKVIEAQLAHSVPDKLGRAYNRTQFTDQRRQMLQTWADYLDTLRTGAQVIPIRAA
jgi:integrase